MGNEAKLLLASLHRMWPDWAAAKPTLQLQSHKKCYESCSLYSKHMCHILVKTGFKKNE